MIDPLKSLGQNFLQDQNIAYEIASHCKIGDVLIEIGPGLGMLTKAILLRKPKSFFVIEKDRRCIPILTKILDQSQIINADILDVSEGFFKESTNIISNLPYNIGTEILVRLSQTANIKHMVLMFQKEVADRIVAPKDCKIYGRLSILSQILFDMEIVMTLPPEVFYPKPQIFSSVVVFKRKAIIEKKVINSLEKITQTLFSSRRKMIGKTLKMSMPNLLDFIDDTSLRPENLSPETYLMLAQNHCRNIIV